MRENIAGYQYEIVTEYQTWALYFSYDSTSLLK
jgi:hypothetical protein